MQESEAQWAVGDHVQTRKKHPCGTDIWRVIRVGADFKMKCTGCGRIVMLERAEFMKRAKRRIPKADGEPQ